MRVLRLASLLFLVFALPAVAQDDCVDPALRLVDPWVPSHRIPTGPFKGKCLETYKRNYRLLTPEEVKASGLVPPDFIRRAKDVRWIANIGHGGEFYVGAFPTDDAIRAMSLAVERFPPRMIAAHVMTRVDFDPARPVVLFSQKEKGRAPISLAHFLFSIEGNTMPGTTFMESNGWDKFALSKRIVSVEEKIASEYVDEGNPIRQYRLRLDPDQRRRFWATLLEELHDPEMTQMYHMTRMNCMTTLMEVLDKFLGRKPRTYDRLFSSLPTLTRSAMKMRGIWEGTLPNLEEQMLEVMAWNKSEVCASWLAPADAPLVRF